MSENETALTEDEQLVLERYREMDENNKQALIAYFSQASTEVQKTFATFHCLTTGNCFINYGNMPNATVSPVANIRSDTETKQN